MDRTKILGIIANIEVYLKNVLPLAEISRDEFLSDTIKIEAATHIVQQTIQACLDLANHIIASSGFRAPSTNAESFEILVENGILPEDFLPSLRQMAQFRNRLVHMYWDVDSETLYDEILHEDLGDFDRFVQAVLNYMDKIM